MACRRLDQVRDNLFPAGFLCPHCERWMNEPVQTEGVRLCRACFETIASLPERTCPKCQVTATDECFPDRAIEREILRFEVCCEFKSLGCTWRGKLQDQQSHAEICEYRGVKCSYSGCGQVIAARDLHHHEQECQHQPVMCDTCHMAIPLSMMHDRIMDFSAYLISKMMADIVWLKKNMIDIARWNKSEKEQNRSRALEEGTASDGSGTMIWRIADINQHRRNAISGIEKYQSKTFYVTRPGYKLCLRAYFNGDGTGETTHLSLFFAIMQGEFDNIVPWPFNCKVTLTLMDQNGQKSITETFTPTPESSSFQRPTCDMNIASGNPKFAKLSVLDDPHYVRDDAMFIECKVHPMLNPMLL